MARVSSFFSFSFGSVVACAVVTSLSTPACGPSRAPALDDDGGAPEAATGGGPVCDGFTMPNPAGAGLPNPAAYTDNGDGTVTDDVTGLVWQGVVDDARDVQEDAAAACEGRGAGWRLPTRLELVSLVDYTIAAPGPTINPVFKNTPSSTFWASSPYAGNVGDAWSVGFDGGYSDYGVRDNPDLVRCVRAPAPRCHPARYTVQAGGLVLDQTTGLTWQQNVDPGHYTWNDAAATCARLGAGWRMPSLTEVQTIIDDTKEYPAVDPDVFPGTPSESFWSSTPNAAGAGSAWYVDFFYGASDSDILARAFRVRCVR